LKTGVQTPAGAGTEVYFRFRSKIPIFLHTLTTIKKTTQLQRTVLINTYS
jgi:hypothetical protein